MKIIITFFLAFSSLFGFIETRTHYDKSKVLETLDIDSSFIHSSTYRNFEDPLKERTQRNFFAAMERGFSFVPFVKQEIQDAGIPDVFLYMAMAESGFKLKAYSSARASGLWQFMPFTAKRFGLRVDNYVDERRDPVKSTRAAIKYLHYLHAMFDKWYLAALAYNAGEGRVQRAIKKAGTDELMVLIDEKKRYLPRETRRYIKKIVHLALMAQNKELMLQSNFDYMLNRGQAYSLAEVKVPGGESLDRVSRIIQVAKSQLYLYNPHLRHGITPIDTKEYSVYIPYMNLADFKAAYNSKDMKSYYAMHTVQNGDTLGAIADRYGVDISMIKDFNNLQSHIIHPKQQLVVPVAKKNYNKVLQRVYEVRLGDTLSKIARKFDISVARLKELNDISDNTIYLGDRIVVQK